MEKLNYGHYSSSITDTAYSLTNGYSDPASEEETRKQLSYPLKEVKDFVNNTVTVDSNDNAVQLVVGSDDVLKYRTTPEGTLVAVKATDPNATVGKLPTGGSTGQILRKKSNTNYDTEWVSQSSAPYSFVGMVVMGTNLTTESSVKSIYGSSTSWTLLSSVIVTNNHVYGNGKALGLTNGSQYGGLLSSSYEMLIGTGAYGKNQNTYGGDPVTFDNNRGALGVPTYSHVGNSDNTGLVVQTTTVYSWKRTA